VRRHIPELDGVRGLACGLVILLHTIVGLLPTPVGSWSDLLRLRIQPLLFGGVDLFFILSGFLIGGILIDNKGAPNFFRAFWARRFARIFPVYYLMIGLFWLTSRFEAAHPTAIGKALTHAALPLWTLLTFTQNITMALTGNNGASMLGVTWSLAIEEQFYLMLPLVIFFAPRRVIAPMALTIILATPVIRGYFVYISHSWDVGYLVTFGRMDALMLGLLLACVIRNGRWSEILERQRRRLNILAVCLLALQMANLWTSLSIILEARTGLQYLAYVISALQYPLINVAMALLLANIFSDHEGWWRAALRWRLLTAFGLVSYGAYMYHQAVNVAFYGLMRGTEPMMTGWRDAWLPLPVLAITFALAALSYRFFERPIRRSFDHVRFEPATPAPIA
jgi:peptidoglycan/LPS O-acetylase OafA/YrhL